MRRCTGFSPSRTSGSARLTMLAGDNFYVGDTLVTLSGNAAAGFSGEVAIVV